jgi:DNA polymerase III delta prime subunit
MNEPFPLQLESAEKLDSLTINALYGTRLKKELNKKALFLETLLEGGENFDSLSRRGCVVLVDGSWGVGKTVSAHALINHLVSRNNSLIHIQANSFLPFGNVNESIASFLNSFAEGLWDEGLVDVRRSIERFIIESTPSDGSVGELSVSVGPFSLSRTVKIVTSQDQTLQDSLRLLVKKRRTVAIVVDDIDRLAPGEISTVFRMVEKMRHLPRVIIVIPVFKKVVTNALVQSLGLPDVASANSFMRKFTDLEVRLSYGINEIKQVFLDEFKDYSHIETGQGYPRLPVLCWYALMHNIILYEAKNDIEERLKQGGDAKSVIQDIYSAKSTYLKSITEKLQSTTQSYPLRVRRKDSEESKLIKASHVYYGLAGMPGEYLAQPLKEMDLLARTAHVFRPVYFGAATKEALKGGGSVPWITEYDEANKLHLFRSLLIPLMKSARLETYLTDNYSMRDIKALAREIQQHRDLRLSDVSPQFIYSIVRKSFLEYRA